MVPLLSVVVASVGVVISAGSFWIAQQRYKMEVLRKQLSYFLSSFPYSTRQLVKIYIWNSGNASIEQEDYLNALSFDLGRDAQILSAHVGYQAPEDLGVAVQVIDSGRLEVPPIYLNPKDRFTLETMLATTDDVRKNLRTYGRIRGAHQLLEEVESKPRGLGFGEALPEEPDRPEPSSHAWTYGLQPSNTADITLIIGVLSAVLTAVTIFFISPIIIEHFIR